MTSLREAAQQALEALELAYAGADVITVHGKAITALRAALAEPNRAQKMTEAGYTRRPTLREMAESEPCQYPDCVDNGPDVECTRWLLDECLREDYKPKRPAEPLPPIGKASTDVGVPVYVVKKAEPVQEPVAWLWEHQLNDLKHYGYKPNMRAWTTERRLGSFEGLVPLYTGAPQSKPMPSWLHYCPASDILIIHGRAYSGAAFAAEALAAALPQEQAR